MAKIDAVEDTQKILTFVAQQCKLQKYLTQDALSPDQVKQRSYSWLLDRVKQDFASRMSIVEAYFTTANEFLEFDTCTDVLVFLKELVDQVDALVKEFQIEDFTDDVEEGGMENA